MKKYVLPIILLASHLYTGLTYATEAVQASCAPTISDEETVLFTIINEAPFVVPVSLELAITTAYKDYECGQSTDRVNFFPRLKFVQERSVVTFTKSDYHWLVWLMDSLKSQTPMNCYFYARIGFNSSHYPTPEISQKIEIVLDLKKFVPGNTYRIIPTHYLIPIDEPANSFRVQKETENTIG